MVLVALSACGAQAAPNWADSPEARDPAYATSRALCVAARKTPLPKAGSTPAPKGCSSEALYYGIGRPANPAAAWRCALGEAARDQGGVPFGGRAMLMTMAANGLGTPLDLGLAIALACTLDAAPEEMDGRIKHLAALRKAGPAATPFGFCDDITSGAALGACAAHDSAVAAPARAAALDGLAAALPASDRAAFATALQAAEAFAKARGEQEIDLSGSGRAAFEIEAEDAVREDFLDLARRLASGKLSPAAPDKRAADDRALNATFQAVMAVEDPQWGTPTKDGIRATERVWLIYRDAVATFAAARYGAAAADAAVAALTQRRTHQLKDFLS